jgi:formiminotetrahydrofolate cyclodeaminase
MARGPSWEEPDAFGGLATLTTRIGETGEQLGAGAIAATVVGIAASLVAEIARASSAAWADAGGTVAQARALQVRVVRLAQADAVAHAAARRRLIAAADEQRAEIENLPPLSEVLARAAEVPLEIAEAAADAATLAAVTAERANPDLRADAAGVALLAAGATETAAHLVDVNLSTRSADERVARAGALVSLARAASQRATAASG